MMDQTESTAATSKHLKYIPWQLICCVLHRIKSGHVIIYTIYYVCMYVGMLIAHTNTPLVMALSRRRRGYESKRNEQSQESYEITAQEVAAAQ